MANQPSASTAQTIAQTNAMNRARLCQLGIRNRQTLPSLTTSLGAGNTVSFQLQQTGLTTGVRVFFSVPLTVTAALTASEFNPANLIQNIQITDQNAIVRTNCSGWQLYMLQCHKHRDLDGVSNGYSGLNGTVGNINTNLWQIPTATGTANLCFSLYIPLAYDAANDLTGSILTQTQTGTVTVTITPAAGLVGTDTYAYPYSAGTATAGNITIIPVQEFIGVGNGIQLSDPSQLPLLDLNTAYGITALTSDTSNVITNGQKQINWPTNRVILSALHFFENGNSGTLNETDVSQIQLLYNTNSPVIVGPPVVWRYTQRQILGSDSPSGVYYIGRRAQPVSTNLMGQVISQFNLGTVSGSGVVGFQSAFEVQYPLGSALPQM